MQNLQKMIRQMNWLCAVFVWLQADIEEEKLPANKSAMAIKSPSASAYPKRVNNWDANYFIHTAFSASPDVSQGKLMTYPTNKCHKNDDVLQKWPGEDILQWQWLLRILVFEFEHDPLLDEHILHSCDNDTQQDDNSLCCFSVTL